MSKLKKLERYLAPLNYDLFFKKIFSDINISKKFLEDFLDTKIEKIKFLNYKKKLTDKSRAVEFDYYCEIDGKSVIIEMQQWYKMDIVKRFYIYHCINTGLQLEDMNFKSIKTTEEQERKIRNYNELQPVITLVWMVDDKLGFTDDIVKYALTPDTVTKFIENKVLWKNPDIQQIIQERKQALIQLQNNSKGLGFLRKNKLFFSFQKNIIKNNNNKLSYFRWFDFASKTLKEDNKKSDFAQYEKDKLFSKMIHSLKSEDLSDEEIVYIDNYKEFSMRVKRLEQGFYNDGFDEGYNKGAIEGIEKGIEKEKERSQKIIKEIAKIKDVSVEYINEILNF